jgi:hypothetical protein
MRQNFIRVLQILIGYLDHRATRGWRWHPVVAKIATMASYVTAAAPAIPEGRKIVA